MTLLADKRGSVALMTGIMAPALIMSLAMGIEVTSWSVSTVELQGIADAAAWAGATRYSVTKDAQSAAKAAADLAEINGVAGASLRGWNGTTLTMSDNLVTAQVVAGVRSGSDIAIKVNVRQNVAKTFSSIFPSSQQSVTVSATAIAEIVNSVPQSPQPCLLALQAGGNGVTDVTLSGSASITSRDCSIRSNGGITLNGNSTLNVNGTYAGGAITIPSWHPSAITGGTYQNAGQVADPYANYAPLKNAFSSFAAGVGNADPNTSWGNHTLGPGTYSQLTLGGSSNITLTPGLYIVNGNVTFNGAATINGSGVTIVFSGVLADAASAAVSLTAPTAGSGSGIPGIVFAGNSSGGSSFSGAVSLPLTGVIYYPNGNITYSGSASSTGTACSEVIAATVSISGASNLSATGCPSYGATPFGSLPNSASIAIVQ